MRGLASFAFSSIRVSGGAGWLAICRLLVVEVGVVLYFVVAPPPSLSLFVSLLRVFSANTTSTTTTGLVRNPCRLLLLFLRTAARPNCSRCAAPATSPTWTWTPTTRRS